VTERAPVCENPDVRLFNTLSGQVEDFAVHDNTVRMYVCGVTPYDVTHLGHAFAYVTYDTLRRFLEHQGVKVIHVQNVTDIDDDMVRKSRELGRSIWEIRDENVAWFEADMRALNVLPPTYNPRASETIPAIIELVQKLEAAGVAYRVGTDVYYSVRRFDGYGRLNQLGFDDIAKLENAEIGKRPGQRDPLDFLLWQRSEDGAPSWDSPWGPGRPGWSAECSAMCMQYLGPTIDIHGGGKDLTYPHHENEIAQSEAATGLAPFVRVWMHASMLRINGEKMSKSLKNLVLVRDLLEKYRPAALRLYLQSKHYRSEPSWNEADLAAAEESVTLLLRALATGEGDGRADADAAYARFAAALEDDLDAPTAIEEMLRLARQQAGGQGDARSAALLATMAGVLGLDLSAETGPT
jgi:cysteinyl-tRNA synthetase